MEVAYQPNSKELHISYGPGDAIIIKDFKNGDLGIRFESFPNIGAPARQRQSELDTPAPQQTAEAALPTLNHPKAIAMHAALEQRLAGQLDQYRPEQQKNIIAYATAQIVNATPMVGENPITLAKALDNGNLVMKSEFFIAHFKTETGAQTPAAESLTQTNQITQRQDIELANMMALSQQQLQSNAPTISRV